MKGAVAHDYSDCSSKKLKTVCLQHHECGIMIRFTIKMDFRLGLASEWRMILSRPSANGWQFAPRIFDELTWDRFIGWCSITKPMSSTIFTYQVQISILIWLVIRLPVFSTVTGFSKSIEDVFISLSHIIKDNKNEIQERTSWSLFHVLALDETTHDVRTCESFIPIISLPIQYAVHVRYVYGC